MVLFFVFWFAYGLFESQEMHLVRIMDPTYKQGFYILGAIRLLKSVFETCSIMLIMFLFLYVLCVINIVFLICWYRMF